MVKQKIVENYFASNLYSNQEIQQSIENTKKEFTNKIVDVDININDYGVYVVTYYFKTKENIFQKIMVKLKGRRKTSKPKLLQQKNRLERYEGNQYGKYKETKNFKPI